MNNKELDYELIEKTINHLQDIMNNKNIDSKTKNEDFLNKENEKDEIGREYKIFRINDFKRSSFSIFFSNFIGTLLIIIVLLIQFLVIKTPENVKGEINWYIIFGLMMGLAIIINLFIWKKSYSKYKTIKKMGRDFIVEDNKKTYIWYSKFNCIPILGIITGWITIMRCKKDIKEREKLLGKSYKKLWKEELEFIRITYACERTLREYFK